MLLDFEQFTRAAEEVERIIALPTNADLMSEINNSSSTIPVEKRREFYRHMNSLFLNVLLNRLDGLGAGAEQRAIEARRIIVNIINTL
ncbi:MAG TPA: hypothetical protein P5335_09235 [Flavobacterium sp.]|nr:hypothetical protein [Flavobacterium sp.]HRZ75101.1 hypothetical protein [Flavobacterium sp.]